jgi:citrate lyase gamma subunit
MDVLEKIFNGRERVQIMRFFLFNPDCIYNVASLCAKTGATKRIIDSELYNLEKSGLIRKKPFVKGQRDNEGNLFKGKGWILNQNFKYVKPLENLLIHQGLISDQSLIKKVSSWGKIKFVLLAGIFTQNEESRVDLMVVCDNVRQGMVLRTISSFEKEFGREIRYSVFETSEFKYRFSMNDKLVYDIIDYPHKTIVNRLNWPGLQ